MLENRAWILEVGLREALFHLNRMHHSNPHLSNLVTYSISHALKELEAIKFEREKGMYPGPRPHDDNNYADSTSTICNSGPTSNMDIDPAASEPWWPADSTRRFLLSIDDSNTVSNGRAT
jgi:hypothetical protein